jgi:segregation and condensation protein A
MTGTPATEAIALLIDLAQRGEIDPWDVQVIEVIDRYLSTLALGNDAEPGRRDADLSQSGQAFLWASMLVLLKADTLMDLEEPEDPEFKDVEEESDAPAGARLPLHLERHLRRRRAAPPPKRRPVTLNELIEQLQQMAAQLGEAPLRQRTLRPRPQSRTQAAKAIAHLAHDENLTEIAMRLEGFLSTHWQKIAAGKDWLNLDQLLEWWTLTPAASEQVDSLGDSLASREAASDATERRANDRVGVFWALLLLSAQSKVELSQEEFYQDLKIRALT